MLFISHPFEFDEEHCENDDNGREKESREKVEEAIEGVGAVGHLGGGRWDCVLCSSWEH